MTARSLGTLAVFVGAVVVLSLACRRGEGPPPSKADAAPPQPAPAASPPSFVVVELFTSEGCSSCPPADALLSELVAEARAGNRPVHCLAFCVDYWDHLGWRDPFGSRAATRRQQTYSLFFGGNRVYTPQMIVDGQDEFVGSDRKRAHQSIAAAAKKPRKTIVEVRREKDDDQGRLVLGFAVAEAAEGAVVNVAVVERGLVSQVTRGENAGRTLRHDNVVRAFQSLILPPEGKGTVRLTPPPGFVSKNASAIVYVQEADTLAVVGAADLDLDSGS